VGLALLTEADPALLAVLRQAIEGAYEIRGDPDSAMNAGSAVATINRLGEALDG
jgi:hypothetical protein